MQSLDTEVDIPYCQTMPSICIILIIRGRFSRLRTACLKTRMTWSEVSYVCLRLCIAYGELYFLLLFYNFSLTFCVITEVGCDFIARAVRSNPTHLKELDLSYNYPGQLGMEMLSSLQEDIENLTIRYHSGLNVTCCYLFFCELV